MKQSDLNDKNDCTDCGVDHPAVFAVTIFGASFVILAVVLLVVNLSRYAEKIGWFGG